MSFVHLYRIPQVVQLAASIGANLMNYPMNRSDFTLFRHVDNDIDFLIKDFDRQVVTMEGASAMITIVDARHQRLLLARPLIAADAAQGHFKLFVTGEEVVAMPKRPLRYTVTMTRPDGAQIMLFTDKNKQCEGTVNVEDGPIPLVTEPVVLRLKDFVTRAVGLARQKTLVAGSFASAKTSGNKDGIHSVTVDFDNFTGKFIVEGSRNSSPAQDDSDWEDVLSVSRTEKDGVEHFSFTDNDSLWIRFKFEPIQGTLKELTYRNS